MMNRKSYPAILLFQVLLSGCSKESTPVSPGTDLQTAAIHNQIVKSQDTYYATLKKFLGTMDTTSALDSLQRVVSKDSTVQWSRAGVQGLAIQYRNGARGGILLRTNDLPFKGPSEFKGMNIPAVLPFLSRVPASRRTVVCIAHYAERKELADSLVERYNRMFPLAGYQKPQVYRDAQVTLDQITALSGFGVIHLFTHGWAWPDEDHIQAVYAMTGETLSVATTQKYRNQIFSGSVPMVRGAETGKYGFSPELLANNSIGIADSTIIYGGFCYSFLGSWPMRMIGAGAGVYLGFDWSFNATGNVDLASNMFRYLTDTAAVPPWTVGRWYTGTSDIPKGYWDQDDERLASLQWYGDTSMALLKRRPSISEIPLEGGLTFKIYGMFTSSYLLTLYGSVPYLSPYSYTRNGILSAHRFAASWKGPWHGTGNRTASGNLVITFDTSSPPHVTGFALRDTVKGEGYTYTWQMTSSLTCDMPGKPDGTTTTWFFQVDSVAIANVLGTLAYREERDSVDWKQLVRASPHYGDFLQIYIRKW